MFVVLLHRTAKLPVVVLGFAEHEWCCYFGVAQLGAHYVASRFGVILGLGLDVGGGCKVIGLLVGNEVFVAVWNHGARRKGHGCGVLGGFGRDGAECRRRSQLRGRVARRLCHGRQQRQGAHNNGGNGYGIPSPPPSIQCSDVSYRRYYAVYVLQLQQCLRRVAVRYSNLSACLMAASTFSVGSASYRRSRAFWL